MDPNPILPEGQAFEDLIRDQFDEKKLVDCFLKEFKKTMEKYTEETMKNVEDSLTCFRKAYGQKLEKKTKEHQELKKKYRKDIQKKNEDLAFKSAQLQRFQNIFQQFRSMTENNNNSIPLNNVSLEDRRSNALSNQIVSNDLSHNNIVESESISEEEEEKVQKKSDQKKNDDRLIPKNISSDDQIFQNRLCRVIYKPNVTKVSYTQYDVPSYLQKIGSNEKTCDIRLIRRILLPFNLSLVQSLSLNDLNLENESFDYLTRLDLKNLISLSIQNNKVTDLACLRNLKIEVFVDLDVSWNPLGKNSAEFLAKQTFSELIYFTVSFKQGHNQKGWEIVLKNKLINFPKIEAIDVYDSSELSQQMKSRIDQCIEEKPKDPKLQRLDKRYNPPRPKHIIRVSWCESAEEFEKKGVEEKIMQNLKWMRDMKVKRHSYIEWLKQERKSKKRNSRKSSSSSRSKTKMIKKDGKARIRRDKKRRQQNDKEKPSGPGPSANQVSEDW